MAEAPHPHLGVVVGEVKPSELFWPRSRLLQSALEVQVLMLLLHNPPPHWQPQFLLLPLQSLLFLFHRLPQVVLRSWQGCDQTLLLEKLQPQAGEPSCLPLSR